MIKIINDEKFKSINISVNFTFNIDKKIIASSILSSTIMTKSNKDFGNEMNIRKYLSTMYGAVLEHNIEKIGDLYNVEIKLKFLNKKFIEEDILYKCVDFLKSIIYSPDFNEDIISVEKNLLIEKINNKKEEKLLYCVEKTEELTTKGEPFSIYLYGDIEDATNITVNDIKDSYSKLINESNISVVVSGNLSSYNFDELKDLINEKLNLNNITLKNKITEEGKVEEVIEKTDSSQSVIGIGMTTNNENYYANHVYNCILGGNPASKLFQNFREKESLAYTVKSRYYRYKGMFVIFAGIDSKNFEKAKKVLNKEISDMNSNISDIELNSAKEALIASIMEMEDSLTARSRYVFVNSLFNDNTTLEEMRYNISKVTKEDIYKASKSVNIKLIYFLDGGENND